jgi:hypothetical protein
LCGELLGHHFGFYHSSAWLQVLQDHQHKEGQWGLFQIPGSISSAQFWKEVRSSSQFRISSLNEWPPSGRPRHALAKKKKINYTKVRILDELERLQATFFLEILDLPKKNEVTILVPVITQQVRQCITNSIVNIFLIPVDGHSAELFNYIKEFSLKDMLNWR